MFALIVPVLWIILKCSFITAIMITIINLAPGGDSIRAIIDVMVNVLADIDWSSLLNKIGQHLQTFSRALIDSVANSQEVNELAKVACDDLSIKAECISQEGE